MVNWWLHPAYRREYWLRYVPLQFLDRHTPKILVLAISILPVSYVDIPILFNRVLWTPPSPNSGSCPCYCVIQVPKPNCPKVPWYSCHATNFAFRHLPQWVVTTSPALLIGWLHGKWRTDWQDITLPRQISVENPYISLKYTDYTSKTPVPGLEHGTSLIVSEHSQ
jgi:hypothetical protein